MDELCGVGGADRARAGNETIEHHVARLTQRAIDGWRSALAASADLRRRAVGLALTNAEPGGPTIDRDELASGLEPSKDTPANNNLVLLAIETLDPVIYALAISRCKSLLTPDMASGPCQGLSFGQWASIDPDNAMPWLWIAAKASRNGDKQGVDSALAKAAAAPHIESYSDTLSGLALGALPGDAAPLEKATAGADVVTSVGIAAPAALIDLCSGGAIQRPLRKEQCSAIATTLANRSSSFFDLVLASVLADHLGFPEDVRASLTAEQRSSRAALGSYPWGRSDTRTGFLCDTVLAYDSFIDALRTAGGNERAAMRAAAAARRQWDRSPRAGR